MIAKTTNSQDRENVRGVEDRYCSAPLFVVGMWRSGTSLLYALLNQHPEIGLMYEDDLFLLPALFVTGRAKRDWFDRWDFWNSAPRRHNLQSVGFPARPSLKEAAETAYKNAGTFIWGTKSPNYYDRMAELTGPFPNARFLIIWRDLGGVCRSVAHAAAKPSWFQRSGMTLRTILGYREMKRERDRIVSAGAQVHEIHYEDLVSNPEATMRGICEFLGIAFDPKMCSLKNADRSAVFNHGHHELVNSSEIEPARKRPEILSASTLSKIARYTALWKEESAGAWPPHAVQSEGKSKPSLLERGSDAFAYRALRMYDRGIALLYCYAPLALLRIYRGMKRPAAELSPKRAQEAADPRTVSLS